MKSHHVRGDRRGSQWSEGWDVATGKTAPPICPSGRNAGKAVSGWSMSVIAFHEKAGRRQVGSFVVLSDKVFLSRRVCPDAMLPSALSRSDSFARSPYRSWHRDAAFLLTTIMTLVNTAAQSDADGLASV